MESSQAPPVLWLKDVAKRFGGGLFGRSTEVLRDIDLELHPGESLGLLGPNGCGKSTLLRIACGIESASAGAVRLFGLDPREASGRGQLGFVPEGSPFPQDLTAPACLALCAEVQGLVGTSAKRACAEMLERVGLAETRLPLAKFSKGMARRFALAQAFVHSPDLLLLDEPSSGLDAEGHVVLASLLTEARERGAAILIGSHHTEEAVGWTDRLALLLNGKLHHETRAWLEGEGSVRLEVEGLDGPALDELERAVREQGGRLLSRHPTTTALLELYRSRGD